MVNQIIIKRASRPSKSWRMVCLPNEAKVVYLTLLFISQLLVKKVRVVVCMTNTNVSKAPHVVNNHRGNFKALPRSWRTILSCKMENSFDMLIDNNLSSVKNDGLWKKMPWCEHSSTFTQLILGWDAKRCKVGMTHEEAWQSQIFPLFSLKKKTKMNMPRRRLIFLWALPYGHGGQKSRHYTSCYGARWARNEVQFQRFFGGTLEG